MVEYPECEKVKAIQEKSQMIGEFLDWLDGKGIVLAEWNENGQGDEEMSSIGMQREVLLASYFNIDLKKWEAEKQTILKNIRKVKP